MMKSGDLGHPYALAMRSSKAALLSALVIVPIALFASVFFWLPAIVLFLLPLVPLALPELQLRDKASQRMEGVERELPFFSVLVNVLGGAGVPLYTIFEGLASTDLFSSMKREALLIVRDVSVFGMNATESFERLASTHPSKKLAVFLYGYTSKVRSGGDLPSYLSSESATLLRELEGEWTRYAARVGIIGSMMITVFGVVPLLLMVVGVFSPGFSVVGLAAFTGVGVPLFTILLVYMAGRMQPVGEKQLRGSAAKSGVVSVPMIAAGILTGELWLGVALGLSIFFLTYGLSVRSQLEQTREVEEGLTNFMKDLMEFKRQEYDLTRAVLDIAANNRYNPSFDRLLSGIAARLRAGVPLDEIEVDTRSRLARLGFLLVGQMSRSGGGTVDTVYQICAYTTKLVEMKRSARAEMRPYLVLSYASPLLLAFGFTFVSGVVGSFGDGVRQGLSVPPPPLLTELSSLLIVVSAASLGLIGAKITDFTVRSTLKASVNVGLALGALLALSVLNVRSLLALG